MLANRLLRLASEEAPAAENAVVAEETFLQSPQLKAAQKKRHPSKHQWLQLLLKNHQLQKLPPTLSQLMSAQKQLHLQKSRRSLLRLPPEATPAEEPA